MNDSPAFHLWVLALCGLSLANMLVGNVALAFGLILVAFGAQQVARWPRA